MKVSAKHRYQQYANQTLYWLDSDGRYEWEQHRKDQDKHAQLTKYGFDHEHAIVYRMNSHGFRCDEFSQEPGFIALGCSFTCGIGLPVEQTWPWQVGSALGLRAWNLGIGSASLDTCFRMLVNYLDQLQPKFVMLLIPHAYRFEIHAADGPFWFMPGVVVNDKSLQTVQKVWYANDQNSHINQIKNLWAMQHLCSERGIRLITQDIPTEPQDVTDRWPTARDLLHNGNSTQTLWANNFLKKLEER